RRPLQHRDHPPLSWVARTELAVELEGAVALDEPEVACQARCRFRLCGRPAPQGHVIAKGTGPAPFGHPDGYSAVPDLCRRVEGAPGDAEAHHVGIDGLESHALFLGAVFRVGAHGG